MSAILQNEVLYATSTPIPINDGSTSATEVWSASKTAQEITTINNKIGKLTATNNVPITVNMANATLSGNNPSIITVGNIAFSSNDFYFTLTRAIEWNEKATIFTGLPTPLVDTPIYARGSADGKVYDFIINSNKTLTSSYLEDLPQQRYSMCFSYPLLIN